MPGMRPNMGGPGMQPQQTKVHSKLYLDLRGITHREQYWYIILYLWPIVGEKSKNNYKKGIFLSTLLTIFASENESEKKFSV